MKKTFKIFIIACMMLVAIPGHTQNLVEDLSENEVTIEFKNSNDQTVLKGLHKQSGRMINYDPGKSITIVTDKGDTLTYQQNEIYRIKRKRPYNMAFTREFDVTGPQHGYHGEYNFELGGRSPAPFGFSIVQGYQLFPWLRLGAGYQYMRMNGITAINVDGTKTKTSVNSNLIFGDAKLFFTRSLFNPYFDLRLGGALDNGRGFYYNASLGCRFGLRSSSRLAFNVAMGIANNRFIVRNVDNRAVLILRAGFEF